MRLRVMRRGKLLIAALASAGALYFRFVRPWQLRWGASDEELRLPLPIDDDFPDPQLLSTRAITIDAPAEYVWPWLAQLGQNKAGFYSYRRLENLIGCQMPDMRRIVPEWQDVRPGDEVWMHPKAPPLHVTALDPGRMMVLERTWALVVLPLDEHRSRLLVRSRGPFEHPDLKLAPLNFVYWRLIFEPGHFIMERAMMLGIKERAEKLFAEGKAQRPAPTGETRTHG